MKKVLILITAVALLYACNKTSDDDPDPTPTENYKVTYSFSAIGLDTLEYLTYLNASGEEVTISSTNTFDLSFERPANNIHAKISIKGETGTMLTSFASYSLRVTDKDDNIISYKTGEKEGPGISFKFDAEYMHVEN